MNLLYERIYRRKQEKFMLDGDLKEFNAFITKAQEYQFDIVMKKISETKYSSWLESQIC